MKSYVLEKCIKKEPSWDSLFSLFSCLFNKGLQIIVTYIAISDNPVHRFSFMEINEGGNGFYFIPFGNVLIFIYINAINRRFNLAGKFSTMGRSLLQYPHQGAENPRITSPSVRTLSILAVPVMGAIIVTSSLSLGNI